MACENIYIPVEMLKVLKEKVDLEKLKMNSRNSKEQEIPFFTLCRNKNMKKEDLKFFIENFGDEFLKYSVKNVSALVYYVEFNEKPNLDIILFFIEELKLDPNLVYRQNCSLFIASCAKFSKFSDFDFLIEQK